MKRSLVSRCAAMLLMGALVPAPLVFALEVDAATGADEARATARPDDADAPDQPGRIAKAAEGVVGIGWESLAPGEQRLLQRFARDWPTLSPERRESLVRGARRWLAATPEERHRWREFFHRWRSLSPAERDRLRERWQTLSPEERESLRDFLRFGRPPGRHPPPRGPHRPGEDGRHGEHRRHGEPPPPLGPPPPPPPPGND